MSAIGSNGFLLRKLLVVALVMFGFGFALVPLYKKICEVTGINNIARADTVENSQVDASRWLTIELDANTRGKLPWTFAPLQKTVRVHPGELVHVEYEISNTSGHSVTGQAIPSYGPQLAGSYFRKLECFCFTQQQLAAGETRRMPVVFVIAPGLPDDVNTITLSYTFFPIEGAG